MYRHFFWCAFANISVAGVSLLGQCTKYCLMWRNNRKIFLWSHI